MARSVRSSRSVVRRARARQLAVAREVQGQGLQVLGAVADAGGLVGDPFQVVVGLDGEAQGPQVAGGRLVEGQQADALLLDLDLLAVDLGIAGLDGGAGGGVGGLGRRQRVEHRLLAPQAHPVQPQHQVVNASQEFRH